LANYRRILVERPICGLIDCAEHTDAAIQRFQRVLRPSGLLHVVGGIPQDFPDLIQVPAFVVQHGPLSFHVNSPKEGEQNQQREKQIVMPM
jgi:hypothetical protein